MDERDEREERRRRLATLADESANAADAMLDSELRALRAATRTDLDKLEPKVADAATYERLLAVIDDSTRKNESVARLKERVQALGSEAVGLAKKLTTLLA